MAKVVLFGNKSEAHATYNDLTYFSDHEVAGFTVDREYLEKDTLFKLPVVPFADVRSVFPPDEFRMLIAVGYVAVNRLRAERYVSAIGSKLVSVTAPTFASLECPPMDGGQMRLQAQPPFTRTVSGS